MRPGTPAGSLMCGRSHLAIQPHRGAGRCLDIVARLLRVRRAIAGQACHAALRCGVVNALTHTGRRRSPPCAASAGLVTEFTGRAAGALHDKLASSAKCVQISRARVQTVAKARSERPLATDPMPATRAARGGMVRRANPPINCVGGVG